MDDYAFNQCQCGNCGYNKRHIEGHHHNDNWHYQSHNDNWYYQSHHDID
jgi:hypothetical protein